MSRVGKRAALALIAILVVACGGTTTPSMAAGSPATVPTSTPQTIEFAGSGDRASDPFDLPAGDYRFDWTAKASGHGCPFSMTLAPIGHDELIGSAFDIAPDAEGRTGSQVWDLDGGRYAWSIKALDCTWTVRLAPIS